MSDAVSEFDEFVVGCGPALLRLGYLLTGDRALAEDLVQEALVKVHRRWSHAAAVEQPQAYVRRVMVNEFASWRRRRASTEVVGAVPDRASGDGADELADRDLMWRALAELPRRQRMVLVLRYYEQQTDEEIAAVLGCAESSVRSLAARAFTALRRHPELSALEPSEGMP